MGKYMKKSKITGDVLVMEVSQSSMGVRTRAKTLALQRLQKTTPPPPPSPTPLNPDTTTYLQLRSRRLEKSPPPSPTDTTKKPSPQQQNPNSNCRASSRLRLSSTNSVSVGSVSLGCSNMGDKNYVCEKEEETYDFNDLGIEASFGENNLEFEGRGRSTRESTPCSFIRDCDILGTPGSATRPTSSTATNRRVQCDLQRNIPTTWEMEEFFACAEQQQQRLFMEKYNFDVVNDIPLPGRYEWVTANP